MEQPAKWAQPDGQPAAFGGQKTGQQFVLDEHEHAVGDQAGRGPQRGAEDEHQGTELNQLGEE